MQKPKPFFDVQQWMLTPSDASLSRYRPTNRRESDGGKLVVAWFGGIAMQAFRPECWGEGYVWDIRMGQAAAVARENSMHARHRYAVAEVRGIVGHIWKWVLIGIGVGALFHGFVPAAWVTDHLGGDSWYTVPGPC
jgi:uncharacterized membrane protein YraQ (UPF0718 family)